MAKKADKPTPSPKAAKSKTDSSSNLDQLSQRLKHLRQDLIEQLNQLRSGTSRNVRRPRQIRKKIAQTLTATRSQRDQPDAGDRQESSAEAEKKPAPKVTKPAPEKEKNQPAAKKPKPKKKKE